MKEEDKTITMLKASIFDLDAKILKLKKELMDCNDVYERIRLIIKIKSCSSMWSENIKLIEKIK